MSKKFPEGGHFINTKRLNEDLLEVLKKLDMPHRRQDGGFTVHSLRHFFKAIAVNAGVPERAVDVWLGHSAGNSVRDVLPAIRRRVSEIHAKSSIWNGRPGRRRR